MKNKQHKFDSKYIWSLIAFFIMALFFSWSMGDTFNELIQEMLYPYGKYPVVVHTSGEIIILPGFVFMWIIVIGAINHILLTTFGKKIFKIFKEKLVLFLVGTFIVMGIVFVLDITAWPIAAKANGYSPCPYDTLLFGEKISTAWSKKEAFCYDKGVQARLTTGTFAQVVQVAKYLEDKKQ